MARSIYERKAQKELESEGYTVEWKVRPCRVPKGYHVDLWGCFDLMAVRLNGPIRWISIKGKAGVPSAHRKKVTDFWLPHDSNQKEIWYWKGRTGWTKQIISW